MSPNHPSDRAELGRRGEALACARLTAAGLRIVARNWRCRLGELDVVAEAPGLLVFCEVKTRRGGGYGTPAAAVDAAKQAQLRRLAGAYLEETGEGLDEYLQLVRDRARELFGLDQPPADEQDNQRRVATTWSVSLDRVRAEAPTAEALLSLCAFLAPDIPRGLPTEQPQVLPEELAKAVSDPLAYNRILAAVGRYSLATVSPTTLGIHRLVQAVIQARLGQAGEHRWAEVAIRLLRDSFPNNSWEVATWPACERLLPHVLAAAQHAEGMGVAREQTGWLLERASIYLRERGQYRQARPLAKRALAITEAVLGPAHPQVGARCSELGQVLLHLEDLPGAKAQIQRAVAIGEATLGRNHPELAVWLGNLGSVLWRMGDLHGARAQYEQALAVEEIAFGRNHQQVAIRHNNLGLVLNGLGDLHRARAHYEQAVAIGEATLGRNHPNVAVWRHNLGRLLVKLGDLAGAKAELMKAIAISEAVLGPNHPDVAVERSGLASVLGALGDLEGARAQLEQALAIGKAALGPNYPTVVALRSHLGRVLQTLQESSPKGPSSSL